MRRATVSLVAIVAAILALTIPAASASAQGVCGGGGSIKSLVQGWQQHGAIDQAIELLGSHVGLDGSAQEIAEHGLVWVTVVKGGWVENTTCLGHGFTPIGQRKYVPAGSRIPMPAMEAPSPGKNRLIYTSFDPNCGNLHKGLLLVHRAGHAKKAKKHPAHKAKVHHRTLETCVPNIQIGSQCSANTQTGTTSGPGSPVININVPVNAGNNNGNGNGNGNGGNGNGSGNGGSSNQEQNQNQAQGECVQQGGVWNQQIQVCEKSSPPQCTTCECENNCKPVKPPVCETCECTKTAEECHPKNGKEGAGEGSGGPGNGCEAGHVWNGTECVSTGGSQEESGGGNSTGGYCRDESTGLIREAGPGEEADQFGYCYKP